MLQREDFSSLELTCVAQPSSSIRTRAWVSDLTVAEWAQVPTQPQIYWKHFLEEWRLLRGGSILMPMTDTIWVGADLKVSLWSAETTSTGSSQFHGAAVLPSTAILCRKLFSCRLCAWPNTFRRYSQLSCFTLGSGMCWRSTFDVVKRTLHPVHETLFSFVFLSKSWDWVLSSLAQRAWRSCLVIGGVWTLVLPISHPMPYLLKYHWPQIRVERRDTVLKRFWLDAKNPVGHSAPCTEQRPDCIK